MECNDALILLSGHIDNMNTPAEEAALQAHLAVCPSCKNLLAAYAEMDAGLAEEVPVPEGFTEAVMRGLPKQKKRFRIPLRAAAGLVAASLVLVVGLTVLMQRNRPMTADKAAMEAPEAINERSSVEDSLLRTPDASLAAGNGAPQETVQFAAPSAQAEAPAQTHVQDPPAQTGGQSEAAAPGTDAGIKAVRGLRPMQNSALAERCLALSEAQEIPVLCYDGLDENFPARIAMLTPEVGEALADLEFEAQEDGCLVAETDYRTLALLQEWFRAVLTEQEDVGDDDMGSGYVYLGDVIDLRKPQYLGSLPIDWPADFAERWVNEENWILCFPAEDFEPADESPAYLVLVPAEE